MGQPKPAHLQVRPSNVIVLDPGKPQPIGDVLRGRTIEQTLRTERYLILRCTDGVEVRISWRDLSGLCEGAPCLEDVRRWK